MSGTCDTFLQVTPRLTVLSDIPPGLLECPTRSLAGLLPGPTLIHLPGRIPEPLFATVLLHGNEPTGFEALCEVLRRYRPRGLPRALSIFIGNVAAAARGVRALPEQADYNRVWPGTPSPEYPEARLMRQVVDDIAARAPFASIDLHNNSGINPHYACVSRLEPEFLHLARLFSRIAVYFERPAGAQTIAMSAHCPSVTVECGRIGTSDGLSHAVEFIEACLHLSHFPEHPLAAQDIEILHTLAIVKVPSEVSMSFDGTPADIRFRPDLDHLNFAPAAAGTALGRVSANPKARLMVLPGNRVDGIGGWFDYSEHEIRLARPAIPAMLTCDADAVRADCLCYLMRRIEAPSQ